ncbi:hypothetical protein BDR22DRAFT_965809 [Usnea florida]
MDRILANVPGYATTVDLQPLFFRFHLHISTELLPVLSPNLPILPQDQQWERAYTEVLRIFDKNIGLAIAERRAGPAVLNNVSQQEETLMERLSVLSELVDQSQDPLYIGDQLLGLFLPLHDGTRIGISYLSYQMSMTPAVYAKLRAEALKLGEVELVFEVLKSVNSSPPQSLTPTTHLPHPLQSPLSPTKEKEKEKKRKKKKKQWAAHHPNPPPNPNPSIAGDRYRILLHDNPTFAGRTQKPPTSHHPAAPASNKLPPQKPPQQRAAKPPPKQKQKHQKTPYQFRPLSEIGRAPAAPPPPRTSSKSAPRVPPPSGPLPRVPIQQKQGQNQGQRQGQGQGQGQGQNQRQAKYGGIKKDSHGVWCVQVLADGRWYRCKDVGVAVPGF